MTDIRQELQEKAKAMGIKLTAQQADQFQTYMELLLEWNEKINLTAITQPEEVVEKHFLDSLTLLSWGKLKQGAKVIDVGTGAGFPGIPLKIARPDIDLTLLDGTMKRLNFLGEVCTALKLSARRIHKRAEEAGLDKTMRERLRCGHRAAVANLPVLAEYCMPLIKMKGYFIAMKGPGAEQELEAAGNALGHPGLAGAGGAPLTLPGGEEAQPGEFARSAVHTPKATTVTARDHFETSLIRRKTYGACNAQGPSPRIWTARTR